MERQKWRKSSRSAGGTVNECVEVSLSIGGQAYVRDSKQGNDGPQVFASQAGFSALLRMVCGS